MWGSCHIPKCVVLSLSTLGQERRIRREEGGAEGTRGGVKGEPLGKRGGGNRVRGRARCGRREAGPTCEKVVHRLNVMERH